MISANGVTLRLGKRALFEDVNIKFTEGNCYGIIGANGAGKSTFLKILSGQLEPTNGSITMTPGQRLSVLEQDHFKYDDCVVLDTVMMGNARLFEIMKEKDAIYAKEDFSDEDGIRASELEAEFAQMNGWEADSDAASLLNGLGIETDLHYKKMGELDGPDKVKVLLARALFGNPDILLMDEPTNHLDNEMLTWLEDYLNRYKGTVIMVTHDRYFLDRVSNRILELDHGKIYSYEANYSKFLELKVQREEMALATERKRQSVLRMELEWAKRGCRARSTKQRARLERLEALKAGKAPVSDATLEIEATAARMGRKTVELHHISKRYGEKVLIDDFDYIVLKNQRLGIIGPNGCGKSTLIKIIAGLIEPDSGSVEIGETIQLGYFAQEVPDMNTEQRVIDYIKDVAEYLPTKDGKISASQMLERFLFTPEMQYAPVSKLSGGEKKRLYLLKVIFTGANVYLFDELSNDIDIQTLTILEDFLNSFPGIVITVSHDRYFLDNVVDRIFEFDGNGHLQQYEGGYTDYLETKQKRTSQETSESGNALFEKSGKGKSEEGSSKSSRDWKQNRKTKLKFSYKEQKEFETIDDDIAQLEDGIAALEAEILANATNPGKLNELMKEKEKAEHALEEKMNRWVYLNDLAEKIESQKG